MPSAILVNELHIKPFQRKLWTFICRRTNKHEESEQPDSTSAVDVDQGIAVIIVSIIIIIIIIIISIIISIITIISSPSS